MPLSDIVNVAISTQAPQAQAAGFGKPLILGLKDTADHLGTDLIRDYPTLAAMVSDGFAVTDPSYLAAAAIFAQTPRVPKISVGRRTHLPTLAFDLSPVAANLTVYGVSVNGTHVTYTSDGTATVAEITAGLKIAIDALAISGLTTTDNGGTTGKLHLAMGTAGVFLRVAVDDPALLGIVQSNTDAGIASDLNAISAVRSDWYGVVSCSASTAEVLALAAAIESFSPPKLMAQHSQDSAIVTVAPSTDAAATTSGSVAAQMKTAGYARSGPLYHPDNGAMAGAALLGRCLPLTPGSETWNLKTLAGVPVVTLTDTQIGNARGKNANVYVSIAGVSLTQSGTTSSGEYFDVIRFRDWLASDMSIGIFNALAGANKVPYTDAGIAQVENQVRASLQRGVKAGGLVDGSITVTAPKASAVSSGDRSARVLNNVAWAAQLAGAIHSTNITGTVTV